VYIASLATDQQIVFRCRFRQSRFLPVRVTNQPSQEQPPTPYIPRKKARRLESLFWAMFRFTILKYDDPSLREVASAGATFRLMYYEYVSTLVSVSLGSLEPESSSDLACSHDRGSALHT
jgi:hypothetical protein